jgi:CATRA-associated small protein
VTDQPQQVVEDAVHVLADLLLLELSPARWEGIAGILEALAAEVAVSDLSNLGEATIQLELAGPVRITRIGALPTEPPPPRVRERINQLIHTLSGKGMNGT